MKKLLFAASVLASAPLSAQAPAAPAQTAPAPVAMPATTAPPPAAAPQQPAMTTGAGAVTTAPPAAEVAGIVSREFPSYDRNRDGTLDQGEFGTWMVKLKTIADPASTANAAAVKTWVNAAFAQADQDKSRTLTLGELTGFLTPARS